MKISREAENFLLLMWLCGAFILAMKLIADYYATKTRAAKTKRKVPVFEPRLPTISSRSTNKNTHKKIRYHAQNVRAYSPIFVSQSTKQQAIKQQKKPPNKDKSQKQTHVLSLVKQTETLPDTIPFSAQFIYPSKEQNTAIIYPLPGALHANPLARVYLAGQFIFIHHTQFGVLDPSLPISKDDREVHENCLKTGKVVFDNKLRLFKTHPIKTCGDQRIYATQKIKKEGLTLHIFDKMNQHAHPGK